MNWIADEHISQAIVQRLRRDGHNVLFAAEHFPGIDDDTFLSRAARDGALILTADKDFGALIFRQGKATHGVVLLRIAGLSSAAKADIVGEAVARYGHQMSGAFTVIEPTSCRIRRATS